MLLCDGCVLEYQIPDRLKRLDAVLLNGFGIIAIEFKVGAERFSSGDQWQLRDYCWNLRDFHFMSENVPIQPILVATEAAKLNQESGNGFEDQHRITLQMLYSNASDLPSILELAHKRLVALGPRTIDLDQWDNSPAHSTRSVLEEAQKLFQAQDSREVCHAHGDNTAEALLEIIKIVRESREKGHHSICFLTGVPGAGKTLVGLHAAYSAEMSDAAGTPAYFASGNLPLVNVLHAALTRNRARDSKDSRTVAHGFDVPLKKDMDIHSFALLKFFDPQKSPPLQHVIVFDEAQRVWTAQKLASSLEKRVRRGQIASLQAQELINQGYSEPDILFRVMERCPKWCTIIALIGGGQEIYDGEGGLSEWGRALSKANEKWAVWASKDALEGGASVARQTLFPAGQPPGLDVRPTTALHLSVGKRCPRAEHYTEWVNNVLEFRQSEAKNLTSFLEEFPILLTRDINHARGILDAYAGSESRVGLIASSGGLRLRADGIELKRQFRNSIDYPDWFLLPPQDIRSSNRLEIAATEFECQGLELDWTCVCWSGDFYINESKTGWMFRKFVGTKWQSIRSEVDRQFLLNTYRVLLTRARFGTVIYIPRGNPADSTRKPEEFDAIAEYLSGCGVALAGQIY